jgi:uncharacterized protein (TIGR00730 family)
MKSILVFCGSNKGTHPIYTKIARQTGALLAERGYRIVYGAGNVGLMGALADAALEKEGYVIGVIPYFLQEKEVCHEGLTELHVVDSMHERKVRMAKLSDGVLVLPGGYGTLDELFEMLTLVQLGKARHPLGLLNVSGYYDHLIAHLYHMQREGFLRDQHRELLLADDNLEDLLKRMEHFRMPAAKGKWLDLDRF